MDEAGQHPCALSGKKRGHPHAHIFLCADIPDVASMHRSEEIASETMDWFDDEVRKPLYQLALRI